MWGKHGGPGWLCVEWEPLWARTRVPVGRVLQGVRPTRMPGREHLQCLTCPQTLGPARFSPCLRLQSCRPHPVLPGSRYALPTSPTPTHLRAPSRCVPSLRGVLTESLALPLSRLDPPTTQMPPRAAGPGPGYQAGAAHGVGAPSPPLLGEGVHGGPGCLCALPPCHGRPEELLYREPAACGPQMSHEKTRV